MNIMKPVCRFLKRNGPTILTIGASAGVVATSYLTGKAVLKADRIMNDLSFEELKSIDTKKKLIPVYIPPVIAGTATIACVIGAHLMNKKIQAGLFAAYTMLDTTYKAYRLHVGLDTDADKEAMSAVHDVYIKYNTPAVQDMRPSEEYILWRDDYHQHPYWATENDIYKATAYLNKLLLDPNSGRYGDVCLADFYAFVKTEHEDSDSLWGWTFDYMAESWDCGLIETEWREESPWIDPSGEAIPTRHLYFWCEPLFDYLNYDEDQGASRI